MADELTALRALLDDLARRRATLAWRRGWTAGALTAAAALAATRMAVVLTSPVGLPLLLLVVLGVLVAAVALLVALRSAAPVASPVQLARLVEERQGGLDDVVATAVDYASRADQQPVMADRLAGAALRALPSDAVDRIIDRDALTAAARHALAATAVLVVAAAIAYAPLRQAADVAAAYVLPSWLSIAVEPGDVRVRAGRAVTIRARVDGSEALAPVLVVGEGPSGTPTPMARVADGAFEVTVPDVTATFGYYVDAGARRSASYTVTVVHPAQVERIDLDFAYPKALGLEPRREEQGGDIYAPEGTDVTLTITADRAVGPSALQLQDGSRVPLQVDGRVASGRLRVARDGSYRVVLVDDDGTDMPDDTEYFIRTLLDRPPDVRVLKPAGDKQVTPLEEVTIEARADDDYGVRSFDLVLQKPGDAEVVVPLRGTSSALTVNGAHTLYLEDLEVAPGDIVSYYVRARDVGRGKPSSETRSDMYFLEVKAFNDEFVAAQSQAMAAGAQAQGVQDLAAAQKAIVVATWKLDSRSRRANRAAAARDITTVAEAQRALEQRAAKEAGSQLQASGGGRRRRGGRATVNGVGEDPLGLAIEAMRRAAAELEKLQTGRALPHEMEALNQLLKAEADVQRRQVARQQAGGGGGGNRDTPDLSALFDQELRKQQETNYETPASSETRQDEAREDDPLDKLRELARRQEALSRDQQDLAKTQETLDAEAVKRRLERLSRDQEALRRELEQLARQMPPQNRPAQETPSGQQPAGRQAGAQPDGQRPGSQSQPPSASSSSSPGGQAPGQSGESSAGQSRDQALREAMTEMQAATSGLREQDAARASERASQALERMRRAEDALRGSTADDLRRRLADVQMEARQIAEAQRRLNSQAGESPGGAAAPAVKEQERLAGRADRLRQRLRTLAEQAPSGDGRAALDQAGRELEAGRAAELMREAAGALARAGSDVGPQGDNARSGTASAPSTLPRPPNGSPSSNSAAGADAARLGADAARALDRVAERLDARRTADPASTARLSDDLTRARDLRDQLQRVERSLAELQTTQEQARAQAAADQPSGDRTGQPGATAAGPPDSRARGGIERLQQQVAEDMRQARAQVDALGRASPEMRAGSTPEEWQPSVSAPGTEAFKQDFARWESLKRNLLLALEKVERGLADELRQQETKDRLNAGSSDAVPDDYRKLVDKYYRALAAPRRPGR